MKKQAIEYEVKTNGMPNYEAIPKATLNPIAQKFLENILKKLKEQSRED